MTEQLENFNHGSGGDASPVILDLVWSCHRDQDLFSKLADAGQGSGADDLSARWFGLRIEDIALWWPTLDELFLAVTGEEAAGRDVRARTA